MIISTFWVKPWRPFSSPQTEPGISTSDILSWIKQEEETQVGTPQEPKESDVCKSTYAGEYWGAQTQLMPGPLRRNGRGSRVVDARKWVRNEEKGEKSMFK